MKEIKDITKSKPKKTLHLYLRVSTEVQKTDGGSLETQLKEGKKVSKKFKLDYMIWDEGAKSGSTDIEDRVVFNNLMYEVRNGNVKHIFFLDVSRASRKYEYEYLLLKTCYDYGVQLYDINQKYDLEDDSQMMMLRLQSMFVQFENKQRRLKSVMGKREHFLRGGWRGGITPFGYDTVDRKLAINKEEGRWIKKMFKMYSEGKTTTEISNLFYSKGIKPRKSKSGIFNIGTITSMLKNRIYIGIDTMIDVDDRTLIHEYKGVPKLVDMKTFKKVQIRLETSLRKRSRNTVKYPVLLRRMIWCGDCGEQWGVRIKRNKDSYTYYCRNRENNWSSRSPNRKIPDCGVKRSCSIKQLDDLVWSSIIRINEQSHILKEKDKSKILQPVNPNQSRSWKQRINSLEKMNTNLEDKKSFIYSQFIDDEIKKEDLEKFQKDIKTQTNQNNNEIMELQEKMKTKVQKDGWIDWVKNRQKRIEDISKITDTKKKIDVVKELLEKVNINHDKKENIFSVEMKLKLPLFNDKIAYNNPKDKTEGYKIKEGVYEYKDVLKVVSGRPRKQKQDEKIPKRDHQHL